MRPERHVYLTPRMEEALHELQRLITARFPQVAFVVEEGFDPEGIYLVTTVDIADTDEVTALVGDRLVELQVDEGLPVYVTPLRPIAHVVAQLRERETATPPSPLPLTQENVRSTSIRMKATTGASTCRARATFRPCRLSARRPQAVFSLHRPRRTGPGCHRGQGRIRCGRGPTRPEKRQEGQRSYTPWPAGPR
jgi:hypothetical protein